MLTYIKIACTCCPRNLSKQSEETCSDIRATKRIYSSTGSGQGKKVHVLRPWAVLSALVLQLGTHETAFTVKGGVTVVGGLGQCYATATLC